MPCTVPSASTVATNGLPLDHEPPVPLVLNCIVVPTHSELGPLIVPASGAGDTVTVKLHVLVLLLLSVAVYVTVVTPSGNTEPLGKPAVRTTLTPPQLSVAVGVVYVTVWSQVVIFVGQLLNTGFVSSTTVTLKIQLELLP